MEVFIIKETFRSRRSGSGVRVEVCADLATAQDIVASNLNLIHQYGLGDDFEMGPGDWSHDNGGEELRTLPGHNPQMEYDGTDITAWYGPEDEDEPGGNAQFRRFEIERRTVIGAGSSR